MEIQAGLGTHYCRDCLVHKTRLRGERCRRCAAIERNKEPLGRARRSEAMKRHCSMPGEKERHSEAMQRYYDNPSAREKTSLSAKKYYENPDNKRKMSVVLKRRYKDGSLRKVIGDSVRNSPAYQASRKSVEFRSKLSRAKINYFKDPAHRKRHGEFVRAAMSVPGMHDRISGENCPRWRGGANLGYGREFNRYLKQIIRDRDGAMCQHPSCYCPENGTRHAIHHIDYNKQNCNTKNLILLCHSCHSKSTHGDREHWEQFYRSVQETRGIQ